MESKGKSTAKAYQEELMKDQPFRRHQSAHTNSVTDAADMGHGKSGAGKNILEDKEPAKGDLSKGGNKGFTSSVSGKTPAKK